jgi:hypothetical protein
MGCQLDLAASLADMCLANPAIAREYTATHYGRRVRVCHSTFMTHAVQAEAAIGHLLTCSAPTSGCSGQAHQIRQYHWSQSDQLVHLNPPSE